LPEVTEQSAKSRVVGKMCFNDMSRFFEAAGEDFEKKVGEVLRKRFPKASVTTSMIDGDRKCVTYVASAIDQDDVVKVAHLNELQTQGFTDLGGGVFKKGDGLWSLKVDDAGNHQVVRSEAESSFGTDLEEKEVVVSQRIKDGQIEVLGWDELESKGYLVDEVNGKIVNATSDKVGSLLFIVEAPK